MILFYVLLVIGMVATFWIVTRAAIKWMVPSVQGLLESKKIGQFILWTILWLAACCIFGWIMGQGVILLWLALWGTKNGYTASPFV